MSDNFTESSISEIFLNYKLKITGKRVCFVDFLQTFF